MHRAYLGRVLAVLMAGTIACALGLWAVDPYGLYPRIPKLSPKQPADLFWYLRLHKPYSMQQVEAEQLIIGSSRSARLSPAYLVDGDGVAYNASLPGITLRELRRMIEHAHVIRPLTRVVAGLDYYMFRPGHSNRAFVDERLRRVNPTPGQRMRLGYQVVLDRWSSLMSVDALLDAYSVIGNAESSRREFRADGTWEARAPQERTGNRQYSMLARQKYEEFSEGGDEIDLAELLAALDFCKTQGIEMILLVSPMHALTLNAVALSGRWEAYLDWQRQLVEVAGSHPARVRLYGLENNARLITDPIKAERPLFNDGVHYASRVGDLVLSCITRGGSGCSEELQPMRLDGGSIDSYLVELTRSMQTYPQTHPREYAALRRWLKL